MASNPPMRFMMRSCRHTSVLVSKSKDEDGFVILERINLIFHICRANSNGGLLPHTIIGPSGVQVVAPVNSSMGSSNSHGNDVRRLLQERDEARAWYSNAACDLGCMDFHLNALQDALTISENRANSAQARLADVEARITGEISCGNFYPHNPDLAEL